MFEKSKPSSVVAEQFRANIQFSMIDKDLKTIIFTSYGPWEGKSPVAANIVSVCADQGKQVVLVKSDMRKSTVIRTFNVHNNTGLSTLITLRQITLQDVIQRVEELGFGCHFKRVDSVSCQCDGYTDNGYEMDSVVLMMRNRFLAPAKRHHSRHRAS